MHLYPVQRRHEDFPETVRHAHTSTTNDPSDVDTLASLNRANWIVELPDTLAEIKDFHFAVSASFRMTQSMGDEYLFDEVR